MFKQKFIIEKNDDTEYTFNVKKLNSIDGKNFYYSGDGRFCHDIKEVEAYCGRPLIGQIHKVDNARIRGHNTLLTESHGENGKGIVLTHARYTRKKNIHLFENPSPNDVDEYGNINNTFVLPKEESFDMRDMSKKNWGYTIQNPNDKSIIRNIKHKKTS